jgi:hypothetical protein
VQLAISKVAGETLTLEISQKAKAISIAIALEVVVKGGGAEATINGDAHWVVCV